MATKLTTNLSIETVRLRIKSLIEFESTDRFKTHFNQIFNNANDKYVLGTVEDNSFKIWIGGRRGVTGIFYPIINGTLIKTTNGVDILIKSRMNVIGRIFFIPYSLFMAFYVLTAIVIQERNDLKFLIPRIFIALVLYALMTSVPTVIYFRTSRIVKRHVIEGLRKRNAP